MLYVALSCPSGANLKSGDYQGFLVTLGDRFTLGSDFNAKNTSWWSRFTTTNTTELMIIIYILQVD